MVGYVWCSFSSSQWLGGAVGIYWVGLGCWTPCCVQGNPEGWRTFLPQCQSHPHTVNWNTVNWWCRGNYTTVSRCTWDMLGGASWVITGVSPLSPTTAWLLLSALHLPPPLSLSLSLTPSEVRSLLSASALHQDPAQAWTPPLSAFPDFCGCTCSPPSVQKIAFPLPTPHLPLFWLFLSVFSPITVLCSPGQMRQVPSQCLYRCIFLPFFCFPLLSIPSLPQCLCIPARGQEVWGFSPSPLCSGACPLHLIKGRGLPGPSAGAAL